MVSNAKMKCEKWAVVTTINPPTDAVQKQALVKDWCLVVVGDKKGPFSYPLEGVNESNFIFLTAEMQEKLGAEFPLVGMLPWNHFGRKNIGYLYAIAHGAKIVYDFDDDNALLSTKHAFSILNPSHKNASAVMTIAVPSLEVVEPIAYNASVLNPYPLLGATSDPAWPRGYPLELIKSTYDRKMPVNSINLPLKDIGVV